MNRTYSILAVSLAFLFVAAFPAMAQDCPDPGSRAAGVAEFAENCTGCDDAPVATCNDEFTIELVDIDRDLVLNLVKYTYEVYKPLVGPPAVFRHDQRQLVPGPPVSPRLKASG